MFYTNFLHRAFPKNGAHSRTIEEPRPPQEIESADPTRSQQLAHEQAMHSIRTVHNLHHLERHTFL